MAVLEEWLQEQYVEYYDEQSKFPNKIELLYSHFPNLLLKDGSRDYVMNGGKVYYLLNKSCESIPKDVRNALVGGDSTEYSEYTRLQDVYGITKDLKVYYCKNGIEGVYGSFENYDINPKEPASGLSDDPSLKQAITDMLREEYNTEIGEDGITVSNVSVFKNLEIDGSKYPNIKSLTGLRDFKNLRTLILTNMNLDNLNGLEGLPVLSFLYLKNSTIGDYVTLSSCVNLEKLYLYLPHSMTEDVANNQIVLLGNGLKDASKLTKLTTFGISRSYFYV